MRAILRGVEAHRCERLATGWEFCAEPANSCDSLPLAGANPRWLPSRVPNTAAGSLRDAGLWSLDSPARRFDAEDFWYRCRFARPAGGTGSWTLCFEGLATVADVWLNGAPVLASENMFLEHELAAALVDEN